MWFSTALLGSCRSNRSTTVTFKEDECLDEVKPLEDQCLSEMSKFRLNEAQE